MEYIIIIIIIIRKAERVRGEVGALRFVFFSLIPTVIFSTQNVCNTHEARYFK
jgi:hypothetical protein